MITDDPQSILNQAKSIRYNDGSGITDDPQEVLNQAMSIRYKGEYSGGLLSRGMQAAQDFGSNAMDALSDWGGKVSNDLSSIHPVQMENRSNEEIQADADAQNQQLGQLYSDAVANPAGKVAITPWVPGTARAVAGALYAPQLANDAMNTYQQNSAADEAQGGDGSGMDVAGKTAYDVLVNPVVSPVKEIVTSPGEFGQSIIDDPANIWNKVLLPGAVGHGAYKGGKAVYDGAKDRYGNALGSLDEMDASIPKAPGAAIMDDPMDVLQQARGISAPSNGSVPLGDNAFSYAVEKSGTPYELGGDGVSSTDCGKLVQDSFNAAGVDWNNRYVPSMIAEAQEKGAWHPAGDGYIPQKGDAAVVLGDNHVILADGEGGYVGANSSTGVIKKPSIADDFGDVTGYISVDDMTGGRRAQAKATPQSDPYRTGESDFQPGDDFKAADIPDDNADIFGRPTEQVADEFPAATMAKESALPPKESFMDMPIEKATPQDFENHIYSKIEELPPEQRPIDISPEMKQSKMLTPEEDAIKIFNDEAQKAGFPTDKPVEFPAAREFSKAPDYQKIVQDEFADPVDKILGNTPEYARGVNEEMMNKAYEAVSNNDYKAAAELARRAGANDWAKQFDLLDKTAGGSKPAEPRLSGTPTGEYTGDTITKRQIVKRAAELFVPIRTGRIGKADVMGFADHNSGVIRIRDHGDLDTMAHEIGHITDAALGLRGDAGAFDREFSRVVDNRFGKDAYEPAQKRAEGIAEFMKDYLTNENKAKTEMPEYYSQFKAALEKNPDVKARVNEVKSMLDIWQKQSPEARGRGAVSYEHDKSGSLKDKAVNTKNNLEKGLVDDRILLKRIENNFRDMTGENLSPENSAYMQQRAWGTASASHAKWLIEDTRPKEIVNSLNEWYKGALTHSVTLSSALRPLKKLNIDGYLRQGGFKNKHEALDTYLAARCQLEIQKYNPEYKGPMSKGDAEMIVKNAPKEFDGIARDIYDYYDNLLRMKLKMGIISQEMYDTISSKYKNHISMIRDFSDDGVTTFPGVKGRGFVNVNNGIKKLSDYGSTRSVVSPLESLIRDTYATTDLIGRNEVAKAFIKMTDSDRTGALVEEVAGNASAKDSTFSVLVNGEKRVYQTTPEIYKVLTASNLETVGPTVRLLTALPRLATSMVRAGSTLVPSFSSKNGARDIQSVFLYTKDGILPGNIVKAVASMFKNDQAYHDFKASGAMGAAMYDMDRNHLQMSVGKLYGNTFKNYIYNYNPLELMRKLSDLIESANRMPEHMKMRNNGYSIQEQAIGAKDITTDFSRHGTVGKYWNQYDAFFNACIQGNRRFFTELKAHPVKFTAKAVTLITLPSVALWTINHDQQWYKELPSYQRDLFWVMKIPGWVDPVFKDDVFRWPKPEVPGLLFGTLPERFLDWAIDEKSGGAGAFAKSFAGAVLPNFLPNIIDTWTALAYNYDTFTGRNIVPQWEKNLAPKDQYGPNTSEIAKIIGANFNLSPRQIDALVSKTTGSLGTETLNGIDVLLGKKDYRGPIDKAFTIDSSKNPQSVQNFYDKLGEAQQKYNTAKFEKQQLSSDDFHNYNLLNYVNGKMDYLHQQERDAIKKGDTARVERLKREQLKAAQDAMKQVR